MSQLAKVNRSNIEFSRNGMMDGGLTGELSDKLIRRLPQKYENSSNSIDVPTTGGILNDVECKVTSEYDATALLEKLKTGDLSAEQATIAFCKRAAIAHQLRNCLTEIFFDEAIERARQLDQERKSGKTLRPFHGLPISLKDSFQVKGYDTSTGLGCFINEPAEENSSLAALLLDLGAILYCKTNLPQSIMTGDSDNNVFGRTLNPHNTFLTAGGSAGGEGALITLRGSVLGVGTDIGGSIRIPALCNGIIYGFKPSVGLVPHEGVRDLSVPGTDGVHSSAGPLATSLRDCSLFLKTIMQTETWRYGSAVISVPWTNLPTKKKLRIGLVRDDGIYTPTPPVRRGLETAADLWKSGNAEVIPLTLPNTVGVYTDLIQYWTLLGSEHFLELFARTEEPVIPSLAVTPLLTFKGTDLRGFFDLNVRRAAAAKSYLKLFLNNNIDAILMPVAPHTAVPFNSWSGASYTGLWNVLDFPAVVLPAGKDSKVYSLYTGPELYKDAPIAIQLVGYRHRDEALTNIATIVGGIINGEKAKN
ncbi:putative fatty-acid amide hydrolase [Bisporella sp. PMI_857]|nr:putative fatty-acid amide hydrolase [Bisporella sp. PMI_857]